MGASSHPRRKKGPQEDVPATVQVCQSSRSQPRLHAQRLARGRVAGGEPTAERRPTATLGGTRRHSPPLSGQRGAQVAEEHAQRRGPRRCCARHFQRKSQWPRRPRPSNSGRASCDACRRKPLGGRGGRRVPTPTRAPPSSAAAVPAAAARRRGCSIVPSSRVGSPPFCSIRRHGGSRPGREFRLSHTQPSRRARAGRSKPARSPKN